MQTEENGFFDFLTAANLRFLQDRDVGLDVFLSGWSALVPAALGIASATVFLLALFHVIPCRAHSIPILLGISVLAVVVGLIGSYFQYAHLVAHPKGPYARILTDGRGASPVTVGQYSTLLCLPFLVGLAVVAESVAWSLFLLVFGGKEKRKSRGDGDEEPEYEPEYDTAR